MCLRCRMASKIKMSQYYDWWFDNALEYLGHLLEDVDVSLEWRNGIIFDPLDQDQIAQLVDNIERLIKFKLTYLKIGKDGSNEKANRAYLPTMHKGKYVNYLGKDAKLKKEICNYIFNENCEDKNSKMRICDFCMNYYNDKYNISQVSQTIYPVATGSLKSQCGVRKMETEYHACPTCAFLGSIAWLDDNPFTCDNDNLTNYILFPKVDDIYELHLIKDTIRDAVKQGKNSNVMEIYRGKNGAEYERYAKDEYSLLLSLFEQIRSIGYQDEWICLSIKGTHPTYQTRYSYLSEIKIPNIKNLDKIFREIKKPYSNLVDKSFTKSLINGKINNNMGRDNKYFMSKGVVMDDFKTFAKAFRIRENCILTGINKELLYTLISQWRCNDGAV